MTPKAGRAIAWLSFALGIAVSVAGNILHSALTPAGLGELVGAAFWPLALMLSIEILTRVRWQLGGWWMAARVVGLLLVGIVAAVLSYRHLAGLMTSWGEDVFNAHLGPLAVDGLMLLAATALLSISREAKPEPVVGEAPATSRIVTLRDWGPITAEEWQGTPEEISAKAFARGVAAERVAAEALPNVPVSAGSLVGTGAVVTEEKDGSVKADWQATKAASEPKASRLHIVDSVPDAAKVEAARQAFIQHLDNTGKPLPASQVAEMLNMPKSTVHRKYTSKWASERRIVRS